MGATFYIIPFNHPEIPSDIMDRRTMYSSDLKINVTDYIQALVEKWPETELLGLTENSLARWGLYDREWGMSAGKGYLHKDQQTVIIDTPHREFVLWHRSIIPTKYRLLLYADYKGEILELTSETTIEELDDFYTK